MAMQLSFDFSRTRNATNFGDVWKCMNNDTFHFLGQLHERVHGVDIFRHGSGNSLHEATIGAPAKEWQTFRAMIDDLEKIIPVVNAELSRFGFEWENMNLFPTPKWIEFVDLVARHPEIESSVVRKKTTEELLGWVVSSHSWARENVWERQAEAMLLARRTESQTPQT